MVKPNYPKFEVGKTYRFKGDEAYQTYGEWTVTEIDGPRVYGMCPGRHSSQYMVHADDLSTPDDYCVLEVVVGPEPYEEWFV